MASPRAHAPGPRAGALHLALRALRPLTTSLDHPNIARVSAFAAERGLALAPRRFASTTRTAQDAAREIGTTVDRIVKSLVFVEGDRAVIALCSGATRVNESRLAVVIGAAAVRRATADEAKRLTGYAIGGVPPFAHATACAVVCDRGLLAHDEVWAASGLPDAVFPIGPSELVRVSGATIADIAA